MTQIGLDERRPAGVAKRSAHSVGWQLRAATSRWRRLPDFIIIGGQRCGTTSLFSALSRHHRLLASYRKEVHYFDYHRQTRNLDWYRANFPTKLWGATRFRTFEATPNYLAFPDAPEAIHEVAPEVNLIAVLRDPVERTHSSWRHARRWGWETRPFEEAVKAEVNAPDRRVAVAGRPEDMRRAYLQKSRYAEHLEHWFAVFDPAQILILRSEDLFSRPGATLSRIFSFVGVDPDPAVTLGRINVAPPAEIDPEFRDWLVAYFAPHNQRLAELIGAEFSWA